MDVDVQAGHVGGHRRRRGFGKVAVREVMVRREEHAIVPPAELGDDVRDGCAETERWHVAELAAEVRRGRRRDDERDGAHGETRAA